jgi:uncharacterized protein with PIN domain
MSDTASRLESIRDRLAALEAVLDGAQQTEAIERLRALVADLQDVITDLQLVPAPVQKSRRKLPDVEKCPRCAIRSLNMVPEEVRTTADGTEAVLWRCSSCGYEVWREDN